MGHQVLDYLGCKYSNVSIELWTSWYPYSLEDLLDRPRFTVAPVPSLIRHLFPFDSELSEQEGPPWTDVFKILCKSIIFQVVSGLAHLHGLNPPIGLRDVKPKNLLMDVEGTVKIIDFGIAFQEDINKNPENMWPEKKEKMYCDVATGFALPYIACRTMELTPNVLVRSAPPSSSLEQQHTMHVRPIFGVWAVL